MRHLGIAALGIVGALAFAATSASAAIVCNDNGDCWHVKEKYDYKPDFSKGRPLRTLVGSLNTPGHFLRHPLHSPHPSP